MRQSDLSMPAATGKTAQAVTWTQAILSHRGLPYVAGGLAVLLLLPTLTQGLAADDLIHRALILQGDLVTTLRRLFVFADPEVNRELMESGYLAWYAAPELHIAFFRPLAALTHWLDYRLWPESVGLMHLHNLLWYAGGCVLAAFLYRQVIQTAWIAGLAALLYTIDALHFGAAAWIANRNVLMALAFGVLTLLAHLRWRRTGKPNYLVWALVALGLSLLAAEAGIATCAYLFAYAVFLDRGSWARRLGTLVPYLVLAVVWRLGYQALGYTVQGSGLYIDPSDLARFGPGVVERAPLLLASQWLGLAPLPYNLLSANASLIAWGVCLLVLAGIGALMWPLWRGDAAARFWTAGMLLAVIPACSIRLLSGRLLLFASLGAMALMAQFIGGAFGPSTWAPARTGWRWGARTVAVVFLALHILWPLLLVPASLRGSSALDLQGLIDRVLDFGPLTGSAEQDLIVVNPPSPFHFIYLDGLRRLHGEEIPPRVRLLAPGYGEVEVTRRDAQTLRVAVPEGYVDAPEAWQAGRSDPRPAAELATMFQSLDTFFQGDPRSLAPGASVQLNGFSAQVVASTADGRPQIVDFTFAAPLEAATWRWLWWDWQSESYQPFAVPAIGATLHLAGPPAELALQPDTP